MLSPTPSDLSAFDRKLRALGESERYWRIQRLRRLWHGAGYEGRPSFWDATVPLRERAPCVQSMVCRTAGRRLSQLVFGDRSFPKVSVSAQAYGVRLDDVSKGSLTALLEEIARVTHLRRVMRALLSEGLEAGTVVVMVELVEGQLAIKHIPAEWCTPTFAADGRTLASLCIERKLMHADGKLYIHKRVIEPPKDCVYAPVLAEKAAHEQIDWSKVPIVAEAPCAFVPALWHRHCVEPMYGDMEIDGNALVAGLEDEVEALDLALSQLHRNALYNGEPQMVRTGVDPVEDTMLPQGRMARSDVTIFDRMFRSVTKYDAGSGAGGASAKSPQKIWNLPAGSDAKLLESSGAGATIIEGNVGQLRRVIVDAMGIVLADPEQLGAGELSARALSLMMSPMLAHADDLRVEYGSLLCALLDLALRLVASTPGDVYLATLDNARLALAQVYRSLSPARLIELSWGEYFEPSWEEVQAAVTAAQTANGNRPIATLAESRALVAPLLNLSADTATLEAEEAGGLDAMRTVLGGDGG